MKLSEACRGAKKYLFNFENWHCGSFGQQKRDGSGWACCAAGAIQRELSGHPWEEGDRLDLLRLEWAFNEVKERLLGRRAPTFIFQLNDGLHYGEAPERHQLVLQALELMAARLEEKGL